MLLRENLFNLPQPINVLLEKESHKSPKTSKMTFETITQHSSLQIGYNFDHSSSMIIGYPLYLISTNQTLIFLMNQNITFSGTHFHQPNPFICLIQGQSQWEIKHISYIHIISISCFWLNTFWGHNHWEIK